MNQRLTRKDLKRDELVDVVGRGVDYAEGHARQLLTTIGVILAAVLVGILVYFYANHRSEAANQALTAAARVFQAPIVPTGAKPDDAQEPSFASAAARQVKAKALFEKVHDSYSFTDAADIATLYLAEIDAATGQIEPARQMWSDFVKKHGDNVLAVQARLDLMELDRNQGKGEQVAQQLRQMLDQSDSPLPQDVALSQLGTTLELLHRNQEAAQIYQRLLDEFPQSPYRAAAQQKVAALDPARAGSSRAIPPGFGGALPAS